MATGQQLVTSALRKLGVKGADSDITGQEMLDGVEVLNDMLIGWENSGLVVMGFSPIASPSDNVRVPRGTEEGIKSNLAVVLAPEYEVQISQALALSADAGLNTILLITQKPLDVEYPDSLPIGAGNCDIDTLDQNFFGTNKSENF